METGERLKGNEPGINTVTLVSRQAEIRQKVLQPRLSARKVAARSTFCELSQLGYLLWLKHIF